MARLGIELYWSEREQGVALCRRAMDIARRLDDPHTSIIVLWARHLSLRNPASLEQPAARAVVRDRGAAFVRGLLLKAIQINPSGCGCACTWANYQRVIRLLRQGRHPRRPDCRVRTRRIDPGLLDAARPGGERWRPALRAGGREGAQGPGRDSSNVRSHLVSRAPPREPCGAILDSSSCAASFSSASAASIQ